MAVTKRINKVTGKTVWSVDIYRNGRRFRRTVGTKREADLVQAQLKADIRAKKWGLESDRPMKFRDLVKLYLEYTELNKAASTHRNDKYRIEANLVPYFGRMLISEIEAADVEKYKQKRLREDVTRNTINHELTKLSHIFKMGIQWGYLTSNPVSDVEKFKLSKTNPRFLTTEEVDQLLDAAHGFYIYPILVTALHTGMRKSELFNLKWAAVDFEQETITVQGDADWHTKNYNSRTLQMTPVLHKTLMRLWQPGTSGNVFMNNGKPVKDIRGTFASVKKYAELEGVGLHTLRHTFASHLVMQGVSLREVQELMGHQSYETTLRYAHLSQDHVKKQVMKLPFAGKEEPETEQKQGLRIVEEGSGTA